MPTQLEYPKPKLDSTDAYIHSPHPTLSNLESVPKLRQRAFPCTSCALLVLVSLPTLLVRHSRGAPRMFGQFLPPSCFVPLSGFTLPAICLTIFSFLCSFCGSLSFCNSSGTVLSLPCCARSWGRDWQFLPWPSQLHLTGEFSLGKIWLAFAVWGGFAETLSPLDASLHVYSNSWVEIWPGDSADKEHRFEGFRSGRGFLPDACLYWFNVMFSPLLATVVWRPWWGEPPLISSA